MTDEVIVDESHKVSCDHVVVVHFPCDNDGIELWPSFNRVIGGLNLGDVDHLLIEAAKGLIVVDVVRYVINKVFEVREGVLEVGFSCRDVLQGGSAVQFMHYFDELEG